MHRAIQLCSLSPGKCTNIQSIFWMIVLWWCSDPTSKHASPKYDFLPDAVNLLSFRLQVAVSHIALADDRTLYLTTRDVKKIMKIKVPEDASAVKLVLNWYLSTSVFLSDLTAMQYHWLLAWYCHLSVCPSRSVYDAKRYMYRIPVSVWKNE